MRLLWSCSCRRGSRGLGDAPGSIRARGFRWLLDRRLAAVLTAPLGLLGYLGWVAYETGDLDGYFDVTQGWGNDFDGGIAFGTRIVGHLVGTTPLVGLAVLLGVAVLVGLVVLCVRQRLPMPVLVYAVTLVVLALTTSGYFVQTVAISCPPFHCCSRSRGGWRSVRDGSLRRAGRWRSVRLRSGLVARPGPP